MGTLKLHSLSDGATVLSSYLSVSDNYKNDQFPKFPPPFHRNLTVNKHPVLVYNFVTLYGSYSPLDIEYHCQTAFHGRCILSIFGVTSLLLAAVCSELLLFIP